MNKYSKHTEKLDKKTKRNVLLRLARDAKRIYPALIAACLLSAAAVACSLFTPGILGSIINRVNDYLDPDNAAAVLDMDAVLNSAVTLVALYAAVSVLNTAKMLVMNLTVSRHFTANLRISISDKVQRMPISHLDSTPNGELISRMTGDVSVMGTTIHSILELTIVGILQLFAIGFMMYRINWIMATAVVAVVPVTVILSSLLAKKGERYFDTSQKKFGEIYSHIEEIYGGYKTVKGYNLENAVRRKHSEINDIIADSSARGAFFAEIVRPVIVLTNNLAYVIICLAGGWLTINGMLQLGEVVEVILFAKMFAAPLEGISGAISLLQRTAVSSKRVYDLLDAPEMEETAVAGSAIDGRGDVVFSDVDFSYTEKKPLIRGLNLNIKSGQKIAIVGPTGAGKTTIVNLLMRFYDIQNGSIKIGGTDIRNVPREQLRDIYSMVLQETWLFSGTVLENVAYGKPDASREEIERACESAFADHFINTLPGGYDTVLDEATANISGGQKQLLTIARAFLTDRSVLILDEATSNVDTRTEILIQRAMDRLMKGRTSFVIAHRLSTIVDADHILVIDNGSVVEQGKHAELLEKGGFYHEIYHSQYALVNAAAQAAAMPQPTN